MSLCLHQAAQRRANGIGNISLRCLPSIADLFTRYHLAAFHDLLAGAPVGPFFKRRSAHNFFQVRELQISESTIEVSEGVGLEGKIFESAN
ncbi:hypothetical protein BTH42_33850 [Burkholderia sp. SRS-W-2-2016]|uniref:hypothetical protein n=1 Tax=Burkholderia sp. SRS-W-2-2016 TaxID=1926878 RepID=UPI00094AA520|nr:hypothetical protein [Burkholderia sp. SRS-W-2-2016]OLL27240.1 hypothetical protein BTH42_33850 [Burkholderia sp. SRS-W-2-2016]